MKRFLLIFGLLGCAWAQTTTTITGTIKDLTGALVTSGKVVFTLTPNRDTTISGVARFTPASVVCLINGSGLIKAQDGVSVCTLTMNTALQPTGTYYTVGVWPNNVKTSQFTFYAVNSSYDWSTVVPTPTTSPAQNYVDVFSNQTVGGTKTFSSAISMTGGGTFGGTWAGNLTLTGTLFPKSVDGILFVDQYCNGSTDWGVCLQNAITAAPSGAILYMTSVPGSTAASTVTIPKPVQLFISAPTALTAAGNPGIIVAATAPGTFINGAGEGGTTISCSSAGSNCILWEASYGAMQDLTITTPTNTTNALDLDATLAGQDVKFNNFKNLALTAPSTSTADGVHAVASDASHKISFNHFENLNIIDYQNGQHFTTTAAVGPTDNVTIGGQFRQTALRGNGILLDAGTQDNTWVGGDISFYTTAINITASASVTDNKFYGVTPESNTNGWTVGAGAADNMLRGVTCGSQICTDSGTRTLFDSGNNGLGPAGSAVQQQGAPFLNLTFISSAGFPAKFAGSASALRTYTFPDFSGPVPVTPNVVFFPNTPTISSGFGASPSIVNSNGTAVFEINVGTGGVATSGVIGLPLAANGWACQATDMNTNIVTRETAFTANTVTFTAASAWTASDKLLVNCGAF